MAHEEQSSIGDFVSFLLLFSMFIIYRCLFPDNAVRRRRQPLELKPELKWFGLAYEKLGSGGFGTVYKYKDGITGTFMAVKKMHDLHGAEEKNFLQEAVQLERAGDHPNVVKYYGYRDLPNSFGKGLVMEYVRGGNLRNQLGSMFAPSWPCRLYWSIQIARGLKHIHSQGIIHQDIKSENILIGERSVAKITDFGIARYQYAALTFNGRTVASLPATGVPGGTFAYMAPEIVRQFSRNTGGFFDAGSWGTRASDIFSFGILLYEIATTRLPKRGESDIFNGEVPDLTTRRCNFFTPIIRKCTMVEPSDRPSANEVLTDLEALSYQVNQLD